MCASKAKRIVDFKDKRVLDLGCGRGKQVIESLGFYIGIDIDKEALLSAKAKGLNVFLFDLEQGILPFRDNAFDVVIAVDILEQEFVSLAAYPLESFVEMKLLTNPSMP